MIHLNISPDLEIALRKLCADSGHTLTAMCGGLMRLGLRGTPTEIDAAASVESRPMGRPVLNVPSLAVAPAPDGARPKLSIREQIARNRRKK